MTGYAKLEKLENNKIDVGHLAHPKYRPDIDGLRAIAIMSVVFFHAFPSWLPGGFIGVDIFFVISGFLISTIIFESLDKKTFYFSTFYARRIKRIFPALLIVLACCMVFGWFALYPDEYKQLGKHVAGGSIFISNFLLYDESGYFDTAAEIKPLLHLWSLGIEEQFYIFWPAFAWLVWRLRLNALTVTIAAFGVSFLWNVNNIAANSASVFYMPHTRVWEILAGTFLAYITLYGKFGTSVLLKIDKALSRVVFSDNRESSGNIFKNIISVFGISLIVYGFNKITSEKIFPGWWAIIPSMGAMLIISAGPKALINRFILSNKLFVSIGLISFPLYLWHWPLLSFARIIEGETPSREIRIAAVLAAVLLAWGTYAFVENPLKKVSNNFKTAVLIVIMGVMGAVGYTIYAKDGLQDRPVAKSSATFNSQFSGPIWKYTNNKVCLNRYPMAQASSYGWWFCMTNNDEAPNVLLLGNSYANHLYPGFITVDSLKGNTTLSIGTCDVNTPIVNNPLAVADTTPCSGNRRYDQYVFIKKIIEDNKTLKFAVIDGLRYDQNIESIARVEEVVTLLKRNNVKPIIFVPHVTFVEQRDLKGCYSRPFKSTPTNCELENDARTKINKGFAPLLTSLAKNNPDVLVFDQNEVFCSSDKCSPLLNRMPIYRDIFGHYTEYASIEVARHFAKWAEVHAPDIIVK